jgi:hypothetical protein
MAANSIFPQGENLRRAVEWLGHQESHSPKLIEEASQRFNLTPLEEEFLLRHFCLHEGTPSSD